tara:strand:- start:421 stop:705 length:285 start_codon:yes stop_codon:yes gene_type:complete
MKRPTKKAFYEYMSERFDRKFTSKDEDLYLDLLDVIQEASNDDSRMLELAELTIMSAADRLIYRNMMAVAGVEMTPAQVGEHLATIEYGLEYIT